MAEQQRRQTPTEYREGIRHCIGSEYRRSAELRPLSDLRSSKCTEQETDRQGLMVWHALSCCHDPISVGRRNTKNLQKSAFTHTLLSPCPRAPSKCSLQRTKAWRIKFCSNSKSGVLKLGTRAIPRNVGGVRGVVGESFQAFWSPLPFKK